MRFVSVTERFITAAVGLVRPSQTDEHADG